MAKSLAAIIPITQPINPFTAASPPIRETHRAQKALPVRLPISSMLRNPQKQKTLRRHKNMHTDTRICASQSLPTVQKIYTFTAKLNIIRVNVPRNPGGLPDEALNQAAHLPKSRRRLSNPRPAPALSLSINVPGVYLSYPFCTQKCTYCNFSSGVFPRDLEPRYRDALAREIRAHHFAWTPDTVYLGGGTPSNLAPDALRALLRLIPGRPWAEATIEAAPGGIAPETARAWADAGINRVSLGVQSFVEKELRRTGRTHTAQVVSAEIAVLHAAGIHNINIDLIAGLSGQTETSWRESLDWVERLAPEHVSVYMLEVDEASRLGKEMLLGGVRYGARDTPSGDATADFYELAVERLAALGIARYEISNFARPSFESRHNLKYWKLEPYAGFGADAHSFDGRTRHQNPESIEDYISGVGQVAGHVASNAAGHIDDVPHHPDERFFVGLRLTAGIRPEPEEWRRFASPIHRFLDAGLLETDGATLRLTKRGVLLSNEVFQEFLNL
jgi:oxygen-independent coproporphyrinogen-3 oxidase